MCPVVKLHDSYNPHLAIVTCDIARRHFLGKDVQQRQCGYDKETMVESAGSTDLVQIRLRLAAWS